MKKMLCILFVISALFSCKYYGEILTFNDDMTSGKIDVSISYDVKEAQQNNITRPTEEILKNKFATFKGISLSSCSVDYDSKYDRDYIKLLFTFDSEKSFNSLTESEKTFGAAGNIFVDFNIDDWTITYHRTITLDRHDEASYSVILPKGLYIVDTNAEKSDEEGADWYFKTEDDPLITEMYLVVAEK